MGKGFSDTKKKPDCKLRFEQKQGGFVCLLLRQNLRQLRLCNTAYLLDSWLLYSGLLGLERKTAANAIKQD